MKFYIPEMGDRFNLAEDWHLQVKTWWRAGHLMEAMGIEVPTWQQQRENPTEPPPIIIPKGTTLVMTKIDINKRRGRSEVRFKIDNCPIKKLNRKTIELDVKEANGLSIEDGTLDKPVNAEIYWGYTSLALSSWEKKQFKGLIERRRVEYKLPHRTRDEAWPSPIISTSAGQVDSKPRFNVVREIHWEEVTTESVSRRGGLLSLGRGRTINDYVIVKSVLFYLEDTKDGSRLGPWTTQASARANAKKKLIKELEEIHGYAI